MFQGQSEMHCRYTAQQHETRAARELLTEAASDMEGVNFEKKGLLAQWQASLLGLQRRDEALQVKHSSPIHAVAAMLASHALFGSLHATWCFHHCTRFHQSVKRLEQYGQAALADVEALDLELMGASICEKVGEASSHSSYSSVIVD